MSKGRVVRLSSSQIRHGAAIEVIVSGGSNAMESTGRIFDINANGQDSGTILSFNGDDMKGGSAINMLSSSLTTGSSFLINSSSILPQNGVVRILANGMKTGIGFKIESSDVSTGSTFGIRSADNGVADESFNGGKIINIYVGLQGKHGNVFDIQANFLTNGTILDITKHGSLGGKGRSMKVSGGVGAELEANGLIAHGKALLVHSNSTDKSNRSLVEIESTNGLSNRTQILRLVQSAASNAK